MDKNFEEIAALAASSQSATSLRFLLLGDVGVGKSTFVEAFISTLKNVRSTEQSIEPVTVSLNNNNSNNNGHSNGCNNIQATFELEVTRVRTGPIFGHHDGNTTTSTTETSTDTSRAHGNSNDKDPLNLVPPMVATPAREITFTTVPGYSSTLQPAQTLAMTDQYLNKHLEAVNSIFAPSISPAQLAWFLIAGSAAHTLPTCAFYFVLYDLKPIDVVYMKLIHERVNLVPVLAKADTVSARELWLQKRRLLRQLQESGIVFQRFGLGLEKVDSMVQDRIGGCPPFAVSSRKNASKAMELHLQQEQPQPQPLFKGELEAFVQMAVYDCVRVLQTDAARKMIAWRKTSSAVGSTLTAETLWATRAVATTEATQSVSQSYTQTSEPTLATGLSTTTTTTTSPPALEPRPADHLLQFNFTPPPLPTSSSSSTTTTTTTTAATPAIGNDTFNPFLPPPPSVTASSNSNVVAASTGSVVVDPVVAAAAVPTLPTTSLSNPPGMVPPPPSMSLPTVTSPRPSTTTAYIPTTTYNGSMVRTATEARVMVIHQSTGMEVDPSNRPNVIMDGDAEALNTVHTRPTGLVGYVEDEEAGFKVEIPNSGMSYQPAPGSIEATFAAEATYVNGVEGGAMQQQQRPYVYANGAYLVPTADPLFNAAILNNSTSDTANTMNHKNSSMTSIVGGMAIAPGAEGTNGKVLPDIWEAAEKGDVAMVQYHLNCGMSPDQRNSSRSTLLHRTAWQGKTPFAVMRLLVSYGANVNLANENGNTVLQNVLMKHDDPQLIKLLLDNGAEAMILNKEGMNTLEVAALFNRVESARYLLEHDVSSSEPQSVINAMQRAKSPDKKAMKVLLRTWQGKEGEKKRAELAQRLGVTLDEQGQVVDVTQGKNGKDQSRQGQGKPQANSSHGANSSDAASVHSCETTSKGGNNSVGGGGGAGHSSTTPSTTTLASTTSSSTTTLHHSNLTSTQQKHLSSRFNLKAMRTAAPSMSNLFSRKN
ncbi:hypothetical protein BGZ94_004178 [Podila epigama]|nr:hypothetical protein BGZ94_004178 [Podila epigama]